MATFVVKFRVERASRKMLFLRDAYKRAFPNEKLPIDPKRIAEFCDVNSAALSGTSTSPTRKIVKYGPALRKSKKW
jgi:hypothetical protein